MSNTKRIFPLEGVVQHYNWGGNDFIPTLLNIPVIEEKPFAEYWLGAHQNASAEVSVDDKENIKLIDIIQKSPASTLGEYVNHQFGKLPYLLKVLDVKDMLSIQVHPSKESAKLGFETENLKNIALNDPNRNYKDDNHKPELMVALSDFWLLHGFKTPDQLARIFKTVPELNFLQASFEQSGYLGLYQTVMEMPQEGINERLKPLLENIVPAYELNELNKSSEDFWAARAAKTFNKKDKIDRGIFSIYLFNLVYLKPGEAIFQDAGIPHAYLEGQNMEIMANSDNVLRGGLTLKHIDVQELLKHIKFEPTIPKIILGEKINDDAEYIFKSPAQDFQLSEIRLSSGKSLRLTVSTAEIFLVLEGTGSFQHDGTSMTVAKGASVLSLPGAELKIQSTRPMVIFRATVPYSHS